MITKMRRTTHTNTLQEEVREKMPYPGYLPGELGKVLPNSTHTYRRDV